MQLGRTLAAAVLAAATVAAGAPAAHASTTQATSRAALPLLPASLLAAPLALPGSTGLSGCGPSHGSEGQGGTGSNQPTVCVGTGLVFIGPSSNVNSVVGPTIISPGFAGVVIVSNGPAAFVP